MLDLPTIKTDILFENSQDFNQTTHARPQHPIVFIHNISLYFNCISSVKYLFKWSCYGHIMPFSAVQPKHHPQKSLKHRESTNALSQIQDLLPFSTFKMVSYEEGFEADSERSYSLVFCMLYHFAIILKQL